MGKGTDNRGVCGAYEAEFDGAKYTYKDYMHKSEIRRDGELYARLNNYLPDDDPNRVEYV